jgi:hypothetical protein
MQHRRICHRPSAVIGRLIDQKEPPPKTSPAAIRSISVLDAGQRKVIAQRHADGATFAELARE